MNGKSYEWLVLEIKCTSLGYIRKESSDVKSLAIDNHSLISNQSMDGAEPEPGR